jgi:hypothetical protein
MPYPATAAKRRFIATTTSDNGQNGAQKSGFGMNLAKFYAVRFRSASAVKKDRP